MPKAPESTILGWIILLLIGWDLDFGHITRISRLPTPAADRRQHLEQRCKLWRHGASTTETRGGEVQGSAPHRLEAALRI